VYVKHGNTAAAARALVCCVVGCHNREAWEELLSDLTAC
jgi:hypothetical protein